MRQNSRTPDMAELVRLAMAQAQKRINTGLPGKIEAYDAVEQKADIQILLTEPLITTDGTELKPEEFPILMDVPVAFPRGGAGTGNFFISWPLAAGDLVHLQFVQRSMDQFLDKEGELTTPLDFRMHNLADAVAYPGLYPRKLSLKEASDANAVFGRDEGMQLHITPGDIAEFQVGGVADVSVAIAEALETLWGIVKTRMDAFDAHVHPTGVGPSGPPAPLVTFPAFDAAIISANLKLKDN